MIHTKNLEASEIISLTFFDDDEVYGQDDYRSSLILLIYKNKFIEIINLNGKISRSHFREGIKYLQNISEEYNLPVKAERINNHKLPSRYFSFVNGWWVLK